MKRGEFSCSGINPQLFIKYKVMSHKIIYTNKETQKGLSRFNLCVYVPSVCISTIFNKKNINFKE